MNTMTSIAAKEATIKKSVLLNEYSWIWIMAATIKNAAQTNANPEPNLLDLIHQAKEDLKDENDLPWIRVDLG